MAYIILNWIQIDYLNLTIFLWSYHTPYSKHIVTSKEHSDYNSTAKYHCKKEVFNFIDVIVLKLIINVFFLTYSDFAIVDMLYILSNFYCSVFVYFSHLIEWKEFSFAYVVFFTQYFTNKAKLPNLIWFLFIKICSYEYSFFQILENNQWICSFMFHHKIILMKIDWLIDWIVFYAVSAVFQPCNGGDPAQRP